MTVAPGPWRVSAVSGEDMALWCRLMRDDNAIHLDRAAAERAGFGPRRVNPGPANLAHVLTMMLHDDPEARFARVEARFLGNVFEGDTVEAVPVDAEAGQGAELRRGAEGTPVLSVRMWMEDDAP